MYTRCFLLLLILTFTLAPSSRATSFFLITPHTGAQTQIDIDDSSIWSSPIHIDFEPSFAWALGGGKFTMKEGPSTIATVGLQLWEGSIGTGTLVASRVFTEAEFCAQHGGNCQNFETTDFLFATLTHSRRDAATRQRWFHPQSTPRVRPISSRILAR